MDNSETLGTLGTEDTERRQTKQKHNIAQKIKKMSKTGPTKIHIESIIYILHLSLKLVVPLAIYPKVSVQLTHRQAGAHDLREVTSMVLTPHTTIKYL